MRWRDWKRAVNGAQCYMKKAGHLVILLQVQQLLELTPNSHLHQHRVSCWAGQKTLTAAAQRNELHTKDAHCILIMSRAALHDYPYMHRTVNHLPLQLCWCCPHTQSMPVIPYMYCSAADLQIVSQHLTGTDHLHGVAHVNSYLCVRTCMPFTVSVMAALGVMLLMSTSAQM